MSSALTVAQPAETAIVPVSDVRQGGLGFNPKSRFFRAKPATLSINQPMTQVEGALKGHLRINETNQQFAEMFVVLLQEPVESRGLYEGEAGSLHRTKDNLICFQNNVLRDQYDRETTGPDPNSRIPQAMSCAKCPKGSWEQWQKTKSKTDIPPCEINYRILLLDQKYKIPLRMYLRSKNKKAFDEGMQNFTRTFAMLHATGCNPNIFDIGFKLSTKQIITNKLPSYVLHMSDFRRISDEEREEFGAFYKQFSEQKAWQEEQEEDNVVSSQINQVNDSIDATLVEPEGAFAGEITI